MSGSGVRSTALTTKTPLRRMILSDVIAEGVQEHIVVNRLEPGTVLPTEYQLMKQYGVGRSAVREAAKVLVQRGLVSVRPGKGMTVSAPLGEAVTRQLVTHLRFSQTSPTQLFEVRELIEVAIARAAALNRTMDDLISLERILAEADDAPDDASGYLQLDLGFHQALARATKNPFYSLVVGAIFLLLRDPSLAPLRYATNREMTQAEHRHLLDAIRSGDPEDAASSCLAHLKRVRFSMEEVLGEQRRRAEILPDLPVTESASRPTKSGARPRRSPNQPAPRT